MRKQTPMQTDVGITKMQLELRGYRKAVPLSEATCHSSITASGDITIIYPCQIDNLVELSAFCFSECGYTVVVSSHHYF